MGIADPQAALEKLREFRDLLRGGLVTRRGVASSRHPDEPVKGEPR